MIGRFQSYNRMKINVKENLINSWTHLKDGLSGSEDIRLKACSILWFFAKVSQSVAVFNTCYAQFHPGEGDLSPLNKKDPHWHIFRSPNQILDKKKLIKGSPLCLCETLCLFVCETLCARLCVRDSVCVKRQSILVCGRLMAAKMFQDILTLWELGAHLQVPLHPDTVWPSHSQHQLSILNAGRVVDGRAVFGLNLLNKTGHLVIIRDRCTHVDHGINEIKKARQIECLNH